MSKRLSIIGGDYRRQKTENGLLDLIAVKERDVDQYWLTNP